MGNNLTSFPKSNLNIIKLRYHCGVIIAFFLKNHDIKNTKLYMVHGSWHINVGMERLPFQNGKSNDADITRIENDVTRDE